MKTNKYITTAILWLVAIGMTSCGNYYRMTSHIHNDGSMYREVYAKGDSAFMKGNMNHNPFLFQIDSGWKLTKLDSAFKFNFWGEEQTLNVKVSRTLAKVGDPCFSTLKGNEFMQPLVVPKESLVKTFKWFYTYYEYKAVYEELPNKGPIPLDTYMTKEEQTIWFRGSKQAFAGLNGMELNNNLDDIQSKFWQWYNRSQYEIAFETIDHFTALQKETVWQDSLNKSKMAVYNKYFANKGSDIEDISLEAICNYFDEQSKTNFFATLYRTHRTEMKTIYEEKGKITELFQYNIWFELTMPGKVISIDELGVQKGNSLVWRVNAFRLLSDSYVLEAESRTINYWAFVVTILLIVLAIGGCWRFSRKK